MAKLSVIFPVGKVTEFTVPSLESALNQTLSDFVIFAVDNTKEGYLRELLLPYQDERIVYLRYGDRFGAAAARNFALKHVQTEFIAIQDSDDFLEPNHLKTALKTLLETKADIYCSGYKNRYTSGLEMTRVPSKNINIFNLLTLNPIGHSTVVMRASINPKYPKTNSRHDLRLWLLLYSEKAKFVTNENIMVTRNISPGSLSEKKIPLIREHYDIHRTLMEFSVFKSLLFLLILCFIHSVTFCRVQFNVRIGRWL